MNKEISTVITVVVIGAVGLTGVLFGGKEVVHEKQIIEGSDKLIERTVEKEGIAEKEVGGLVEIFQKIFPEGLVIGNNEKENVFQTDSTNKLYIGATSSNSNYAPIEIDLDSTTGTYMTIRNVNYATSSLNWSGDFSAGDTALYVDISERSVGFGTSSPMHQVEIANSTNTVLALTATSTNDTIIIFNSAGGAEEWAIFMDNSDNDEFTITTTTNANLGQDILTIDAGGNIEILKGIHMASSTITNASITDLSVVDVVTIAGELIASGTTTVTNLVEGGGVWSTTSINAGTSTAYNVCNNNVWNITPNTQTVTFYLPATSTLYTASTGGCFDSNGFSKEILIHNASTVCDHADIVITRPSWSGASAGGGIVLKGASTTDEVSTPKVGCGGTSILKLWRVNTSSTIATLLHLQDAD